MSMGKHCELIITFILLGVNACMKNNVLYLFSGKNNIISH